VTPKLQRRGNSTKTWATDRPAALFGVVAACASTLMLAPLLARGAEVEQRPVPVVDLHVDLSYQHNFKAKPFGLGTGQYAASALLQSGVVGVVLPLYVPRRVSESGPRMRDLDQSYAAVSTALSATKPYAPKPGCVAPVGQVRTWFAFEGSAPLASEPEAVRRWVQQHVRLFGFVHTYDNALASSSGTRDAPDRGLTERGRDLVRRIAEAGAMVDVSHASDRATDEIVKLAGELKSPVVATHSNARALRDHRRNLSDAQIRAIAAAGGVVGVNFHGPFLVAGRPATLDDVVQHVLHMVRVAGAEHVAIGSDFEGDIRPPRALRDVSRFQVLARALQRRGMSRGDVERVFSANALRLLCPKG
jgi:membrane dipeptidase